MYKMTNPAPAGKALSVPLFVAEGRINQDDVWRLELVAFGVVHCFDLRRWSAPSGEIAAPSTKGLTLSIKHLRAIAAAFDDAVAMTDSGEA